MNTIVNMLSEPNQLQLPQEFTGRIHPEELEASKNAIVEES